MVNCDDTSSSTTLACLETLSIDDLAAGENLEWKPCVDGKILTRTPVGLYEEGLWNHHIDMMIGELQVLKYNDTEISQCIFQIQNEAFL